MAVDLESDTLEITKDEIEYTRAIIRDFIPLVEKYRSFYITLFQNYDNRKICVKFSCGEIKKATIEKIDKGED